MMKESDYPCNKKDNEIFIPFIDLYLRANRMLYLRFRCDRNCSQCNCLDWEHQCQIIDQIMDDYSDMEDKLRSNRRERNYLNALENAVLLEMKK